MTTILDRDWLSQHPLPRHDDDTDKNRRGRVLIAGGSRFVPGALRLTGEAALRSGCGKLQMATVEDVAIALGLAVPEAAVIALPADHDGEIGTDAAPIIDEAIAACDTFVLGPGMSESDGVRDLVEALCAEPRADLSILLDAAALGGARHCADLIRGHGGRVVLTPHHGEAAALLGCDADAIREDPEGHARQAAERFSAVVAIKGQTTQIASPDGSMLHYHGGGPGLATGGSGDVLAGIAGGLMSQGTEPIVAAAWAVWLHGEAGRALADTIGPVGFLAHELVPMIPGLMADLRQS